MADSATNPTATRGVAGLSLGERQELFARLLGQFLVWTHSHPTWRIRMGEGFVGLTDGADGDYDGPHMRNGEHYNKLAQDLDLFIVDEAGLRYHVTSSHPAWDEMGATWLGLHPLCRWGGNFASRDYCHFSLTYQGMA